MTGAYRVTVALALMTLALEARATAQVAGGPQPGMRRMTLTAHWTGTTAAQGEIPFPGANRSTETLDATLVFDVPPTLLNFGPDGLWFASSSVRPVSTSGSVRYAGEAKIDAGCTETAAVQSHTTQEDGSATWQPNTGIFVFHVDPNGRMQSLTLKHALQVSSKTTSPCPKFPVSSPKTEERMLEGGFAIPPAGGEMDPGWSIDVKETPTGYSGTARYHRLETGSEGQEEVTKTLTFTLDLGGPLKGAGAAPPPPRPAAFGAAGPRLTRGQVSFTQGGKDAQWPLLLADVRQAGSVPLVSLAFGPPGGSNGSLGLGFTNRGGAWILAALEVQDGPGGSTTYDADAGDCTLSLTRSGPDRFEGSVTCTGRMQGAPITKLNFSATP